MIPKDDLAVSESPQRDMLVASVLTSPEGLRVLEADWSDLFRRAGCENPFLSFDWLAAWWDHFGAGNRLFLITVRNVEKQLVALAPLCLMESTAGLWRIRRLGFLGIGPSDRLDLLAAPACLKPAVHAIADLLVERQEDWDCIELSECDEASSALIELRHRLKQLGLAEQVRTASVCPYVVLPASFDEYLQGLGPNLRRNFRRRLRTMQSRGKVEFLEFRSADDVRAGFEELVALHRLRFSQKGAESPFLQRELPFHRDILRRSMGREWAHVFVLRIDGRTIGAWFGFSLGRVFFSYQCGMDPEWSKLSVGLVTLGSTIESAIKQGHREVDFLRGAEGYKFQWTDQSRRTLAIRLYSGRLRSQCARAQAAARAGTLVMTRRLRNAALIALRRLGPKETGKAGMRTDAE